MAKKTGVSIRQSVYKTFRGADFSTDPSLVDYSRSPLCTNIVADGGGMPQKRLGWRVLWQKDKPVYGLFAGRFDGAEKKLAHIGTALYAWDDETAPTEILTGLPERRSRAAYLAGKLWIVTQGRGSMYTMVQRRTELHRTHTSRRPLSRAAQRAAGRAMRT